ncbi:MAG TPA: T9SS type A sorting domain-containing protein [Cyclobacteriaceae bacterium]
MRPSYYYLLFFLLCSLSGFGQFTLTPILRDNSPSHNVNSRSKETTPKKLPFWDDFSFTKGFRPADSLWQFGQSVWLNNGIGINPPSLGVVTFDGLDSLGKPYNINDVLAKGFADRLVSQPVQLDLVDPAQRATVYISFFYQLKGRGELPDAGDMLRLSFLNKSGVWETVWSMENDNTQQTDVFYPVIIAVPANDDRFFHDKFQFRFQNFARLSGPYDAWNLDYVYLNQGRSETDTSFPDRTLSRPLTSLLSDYYSIPVKHSLKDPASLLSHAEFTMYNLRVDNNQPLNYFNTVTVRNFIGEDILINKDLLDSAETVGSVEGLQTKTASVKTLPPADFFSPDADSLEIDLELSLSTKDNVAPADNGDYIAAKYAPVDFRWNDTTRTHYRLSNYYAYDDGTAEYGAGIRGFGVQVMYRFEMKTTEPDTLVGVRIYFPRFGDESSQLIQLQIFQDLEGTGASTLYVEPITVQRSESNQFVNYKFARFVGVQGSFYLGWKQNTSAAISVGLDKNTDSSNKIFYNLGGAWEKDSNTTGSLMIRPVFGKGGLIVGLPERKSTIPVYPNPTNGVFFLSPLATQLRVIDLTGREINFQSEHSEEHQRVDLGTAPTGIYVVRYRINESIRTEKIILQK